MGERGVGHATKGADWNRTIGANANVHETGTVTIQLPRCSVA